MIKEVTLDYTCDMLSSKQRGKSLAARRERMGEEQILALEEVEEEEIDQYEGMPREFFFNFDFESETKAVLAPLGDWREIYRGSDDFSYYDQDRSTIHDLGDALTLAHAQYVREESNSEMSESDFAIALACTSFDVESNWYHLLSDLNCPVISARCECTAERDDSESSRLKNTSHEIEMLFYVRVEDYDTLQAEVAARMLAEVRNSQSQ